MPSSPVPALDLSALFPPAPDGMPLQLREVRLGRGIALALPVGSAGARATLALYPAQRARARLARWLLGAGLQLGLRLGTRLSLDVVPDDPFPAFLRAAGADFGSGSPLGVFAGRADLRRFVLLLLGGAGSPRAVVKVGSGAAACDLVRRERAFLAAAPGGLPGMPLLRGSFDSADLAAFATDYVAGYGVAACTPMELRSLLSPWLVADESSSLLELPQGEAIRAAVAGSPAGQRALAALGGVRFRPAIGHGDLAPWNLRRPASHGSWIALDWEQGRLRSVPCWDWFHCVVQRELLVERAGAPRLANALLHTLADPHFAAYAAEAGVGGHARELLILFLHAHRAALGTRPGEEASALLGAIEILG